MQIAQDTDPMGHDMVQPALDRVAQLAALPPDWDSYGANPPTEQAVARANALLLAVGRAYGGTYGPAVRPYAIAPLDDGGLQLEWRGGTGEIEVEIGPQAGLAYLFIDKTGSERSFVEQDDAAWSDVTEKIAQVLSRA